MKTAKKTKQNPFTHEARTKVPKWVGKAMEEDAASKGLKATDIMRQTLMEKYADKAPATADR